ncbi:MAG: hypothetical protein LBJ12_09915 [Oscillospiraceae bacterium]|jgi:hypothetical protein|nr:hypothetical protein [Oscillospiraceae bacterium]
MESITPKWSLFPPGNNPILIEKWGMRLGDSFFYLAAIVIFVGVLVFAFRKKPGAGTNSQRIRARKGGEAVIPVPVKKIRWVILDVILLLVLFAGSILLGRIIQALTHSWIPGQQIDGGLVLAIPVLFFGSALLFPKMTLLERVQPFLFIAPMAVMVLKIGCFIEQVNYGIPVSWGIPVYRESVPATKYGEDVRIFPYNICILLLCLTASVLVILRNKQGKHFQHIPLLFYGSAFFLDFFLGRDIGPRPLGISVIGFCHFLILVSGIYLLVLEKREDKRQKAFKHSLNNGKRGKKHKT